MTISHSTISRVTLLVALAGLSACSSAPEEVPGGSSAAHSENASETRDESEELTVYAPLRAVAGAMDEAGRGAGAAIYTGVELRPESRAVLVHVTDLNRSSLLLEAAQAANPTLDLSLVHFDQARYSKAQLHEARDQLEARLATDSFPYRVHTITVPTNGESLQIGVEDVAAAETASFSPHPKLLGATPAEVLGVELSFDESGGIAQKDRYADTSPFVAGDYLQGRNRLGGGTYACTLGLTAVDAHDNPVVVTADHCFGLGWSIYTGSNAHLVGTVTATAPRWDALMIAGHNLPIMWEGNVYHPLVGTAYSYKNDKVCQDGFTSYDEGFGSICGIQVTNEDVSWLQPGQMQAVRGVRGHQIGGHTASRHGDSGGLVYASSKTANAREVRGIVSGTPLDKNGNDIYADMLWTEAVDIFHQFDIHLNPN